MTQKQIILSHLRKLRFENPNGGWIYAYDLRGKQTPYGFTGHQADRRAREMASNDSDMFNDPHYKVLEQRIHNGKAQYRYALTAFDIIELRNKTERALESQPVPNQFKLFA